MLRRPRTRLGARQPVERAEFAAVLRRRGKGVLTGSCSGMTFINATERPHRNTGRAGSRAGAGARNRTSTDSREDSWRRAMSSTSSAISPKVGRTGRPSAKDASAKTFRRRGSPGAGGMMQAHFRPPLAFCAIGRRSCSKADCGFTSLPQRPSTRLPPIHRTPF